jgi:cobalt-zinc-cadmium resistance protein CzcA
MLDTLVRESIRLRFIALGLLGAVLVGGVIAALRLPVDAIPDVSTIQVSVLTEAPGLSPEEVEQRVTFPIEAALNGVPQLVELRSVSRSGLSAVTVVFRDGTDVWFARQLVLERLRGAEGDLPRSASRPQLAPVSTGLGEIFQFVVRSNHHSPSQLRSLLDWEIVPRLRSVPGIIEVNTMGGDLKQYQVVVNPAKLHAYRLTLREVREALERASPMVGGGYLERRGESLSIRGVGRLADERAVGDVSVRTADDGTPVLVRHIGTVQVAAALRYGVVTRDGDGEAVTGIAMMLLGANSKIVIEAVKQRVDEIARDLPAGVVIDAVYDRSDFVGRTLSTVLKNLVEGALVVGVLLALLLGTVRGALAVVLGIPASMAVALFGMHLFGVTGDLMSLGAIDFGFLVDGPIIMLEAVVAATAGQKLASAARGRAYADVGARLVKPVAFSVAIILLVYVPLLALEGVEGKMFRPMAITMACALFGALVYSVLFFPALLSAAVPPPKGHGPRWLERASASYERTLRWALRRRRLLATLALVLFAGSLVLLSRGGADFVPRMDEGDMVVTIRRSPSIGLEEARKLDLAVERVLKRLPEVVTAVGMTGRAEVASDPVGNDNTDIMVRLRPKQEWATARDLDGLSERVKTAVEREVPGTFVSVSQPIEDRTNELISGSRADVQIQVYGPELSELKRISEAIGGIVRGVPGTGDVRVERVLGLPMLTVTPTPHRLARYGVRAEDALAVLEAARVGVGVGQIYEGQRRYDLRLLLPPRSATVEALGDLFVDASGGQVVPLAEVATIQEQEGPAQIRREALTRTVRVEVNLRGRDLVSWVEEARRAVAAKLQVPTGYRVTWGGQFENFERASRRLAIVLPLSLAVIFLMLLALFQQARYALAVFANVPLALTGGAVGLALRDLPFSVPAAVGFIALAGVSVLNGVVISAEVRRLAEEGAPPDHAVEQGSVRNLRAVVTTAAVAAFGFLPMAIATGAGAEVQRPLATVVIAGMIASTVLTLIVFPGILRMAMPSAAGAGVRPAQGDGRGGQGGPALRHGA